MVVVEVNGYTIEPGTNLGGANLAGACLDYADLTGVDLTGAILTGAFEDGHTVWPDGFDPLFTGVIFD